MSVAFHVFWIIPILLHSQEYCLAIYCVRNRKYNERVPFHSSSIIRLHFSLSCLASLIAFNSLENIMHSVSHNWRMKVGVYSSYDLNIFEIEFAHAQTNSRVSSRVACTLLTSRSRVAAPYSRVVHESLATLLTRSFTSRRTLLTSHRTLLTSRSRVARDPTHESRSLPAHESFTSRRTMLTESPHLRHPWCVTSCSRVTPLRHECVLTSRHTMRHCSPLCSPLCSRVVHESPLCSRVVHESPHHAHESYISFMGWFYHDTPLFFEWNNPTVK